MSTDADEICGHTFDHDFPEPEYLDGEAVLVCRRCGAEIFEPEPPRSPGAEHEEGQA